MWNLLKSELLKLRRCQILLVGLVALALCPLVQYGSQLIMEAEYRNPNYDFSALFENVVWGNTQIFLPISLVMAFWLVCLGILVLTCQNTSRYSRLLNSYKLLM